MPTVTKRGSKGDVLESNDVSAKADPELGTTTKNPDEKDKGKSNPEPDSPSVKEDKKPPDYEVDDEFNLPVSLALLMLVLYMMLGALIFTIWEEWSFFEAVYFVFISMSTIGFGDYVPDHPMFMMATFIYLLFGLALTSMCINVVQEKISDLFERAKLRLGTTMGLDMNAIMAAEAAAQEKSKEDKEKEDKEKEEKKKEKEEKKKEKEEKKKDKKKDKEEKKEKEEQKKKPKEEKPDLEKTTAPPTNTEAEEAVQESEKKE